MYLHTGSRRNTLEAAVRFNPTPPAFIDSNITVGESGLFSLNHSIASALCFWDILPSRRTKLNPWAFRGVSSMLSMEVNCEMTKLFTEGSSVLSLVNRDISASTCKWKNYLRCQLWLSPALHSSSTHKNQCIFICEPNLAFTACEQALRHVGERSEQLGAEEKEEKVLFLFDSVIICSQGISVTDADRFLVSGDSFHALRFPGWKKDQRSLQALLSFSRPSLVLLLSVAARGCAWLFTMSPSKELARRLSPWCLCSQGCRKRIPLLITTAHVGGKRGPQVNLTSGCRCPLENVWYLSSLTSVDRRTQTQPKQSIFLNSMGQRPFLERPSNKSAGKAVVVYF